MNEPKLAAAAVDAERVVRKLVDAFNSLKGVQALPTCSSPREEEQRPAQLQEGCEPAFELVGERDAPSTMSVYPSPAPGTPIEASTGPVSNIDEEEPEQVSAFQGARISEPSGYQIEAPKTQHEIIEELCADREVLERVQVTPEELQALSHAAMLGSLTCKQDALFMLRQVREATNPAKPQTTVPSKPLDVQYERIESSKPDISEMLDRMRREALAKLDELDSLRDAERGGRIWRRIMFPVSIRLGWLF